MADRICMELILMRFEVAKLGKLLIAIVQFTAERLRCGMHNLMCSYISVLGERLTANVAVIRSLTSVSSLVSLEVSKLTETLAA